jgi:hypothetical protein
MTISADRLTTEEILRNRDYTFFSWSAQARSASSSLTGRRDLLWDPDGKRYRLQPQLMSVNIATATDGGRCHRRAGASAPRLGGVVMRRARDGVPCDQPSVDPRIAKHPSRKSVTSVVYVPPIWHTDVFHHLAPSASG